MINLIEHLRSDYCMHGQDGIHEKLCEVLPIKNKFFVEFGSAGTWEGQGNTPFLRSIGWTGLLMDRDLNDNRDFDVKKEFVTADNIQSLLEKYNVPKEFGFLSIDVDGQDYWIWKAITDWSPDIVCIESNHAIDLDRSITVPKNNEWKWDGSEYYGASRLAMLKLGRSKGYALVAICVTDMIFIKEKFLNDLEFKDVNDIEKLDYSKSYKWISKIIREKNNAKEWIEV